MLSLLTDEQISYVVAEQVTAKRPDTKIISLKAWQGGAFEGAPDEVLLQALANAALTLVTYDQKTIPPLLMEWGASGKDHVGVVFVDNRSISPADFGGLTLALIQLWDEGRDWDWENRVHYLCSVR